MDTHTAEEETNYLFDKKMYGALLRLYRLEAGYKKIDDFLSALLVAGVDVPKATLYRIERGDQEPSIAFVLITNLLLLGNVHSGKIIDCCVSESWITPEKSSDITRELKRSGVLRRNEIGNGVSTADKAAYYDQLMYSMCAFDFDVFANGNCTDDRLFISVRYGLEDECGIEDIESYEIYEFDDIERSIIHFLKGHQFELPGEEIVKLVQYGQRKLMPMLEEYDIC